jgi:DNA-binding LytR/AlgR family response regulator
MIKILIIEDEIPARQKLKRFIEEVHSKTEIIAELDTVQVAIEFLNLHQPDLIFSDIELLDGNAFEIYKHVSVTCPIIFTTAYDQFWMDAFDGNGIAYLLKPFSKERLKKAWDKFQLLKQSASAEQNALVNLTQLIQMSFSDKSYKKRFMINTHQGIYFLYTESILFFEANEGVVFAHDHQGNKHMLAEPTLKEIEQQLNPSDFYRINRGELIHKLYIEKIERYQKNTLAIKLKGYETPLKTSQSQTAAFMEWLKK